MESDGLYQMGVAGLVLLSSFSVLTVWIEEQVYTLLLCERNIINLIQLYKY